uniref:Uncharacterized protein n=1 Tax=Plectus sambesii TaxID=2011161 RepID=A0A914XT99_9BILA
MGEGGAAGPADAQIQEQPQRVGDTSHLDGVRATQYGALERLRELVDCGQATVDDTDADDCSLMHWAAINNRKNIVEYLFSKGAKVNVVGGVLKSTPLHWAARQGHLRMVALLVNNGADQSICDVEGFAPLHVAVQFAHTPIVAYLIAKGQSVDCPDESGMTPAMWAAYKIYTTDPLKLLMTLGADLTLVDRTNGNTALHWATIQGNHTAVSILLKHGVSVEPVNNE